MDLADAMGQSIIQPYSYVKNNFDDIFQADPSDHEVYEYGRHVGQILQDVAGVIGGAVACKALVKACPKLVKLFKKMDNICFTGDTLIYTSEGTKPIEDIKVGDEVYSEDPESGEKGLKKVTRVFINETDVLVKVYAGNEIIKATPAHPFWVEGKGWVAAGELIQGDNVRLYSGQFLEISKVILERLPETIKVYNFEVEGWHTYFVSESNVLVHNTCNINLSRWHSGSFDTVEKSFMVHYKKHGAEVGATSPDQYLNKATEFAKNLKGARKANISGETEGVIRYYKNGKYIDIAPDGRIVSFGKQ